MAIGYPPKYRYGCFDPWDREAFALITTIAQDKNYPTLTGTDLDKQQFLTTFIRAQKSLHDWRDLLKATLQQVQETEAIDTASLNALYPPESISQETPAWVTYPEDEIVNNFIDELATRKVRFIGTDAEMGEFVLRFILGQLGHDWEQTILMIWEMLGSEQEVSVSELNRELRNFDYLKLFE